MAIGSSETYKHDKGKEGKGTSTRGFTDDGHDNEPSKRLIKVGTPHLRRNQGPCKSSIRNTSKLIGGIHLRKLIVSIL